METSSIVGEKAYHFAVDIISVYQNTLLPSKEFVLSKQLVRSGTSIGANIHEALGSYSKREFAAKMSIAYKEARETEYWIHLLHRSKHLSPQEFDSLSTNLKEICKMLYRIVQSSKSTSVK